MTLRESPLDRLVRVHKALGSAYRLRILAMLAEGELCVCQITATLRLAPSTVSAHLSELKDSGLVLEEKEGRWVRYRLATSPESARLLATIAEELRPDPCVAGDRRVVRDLLKIPVETLCRADLDIERLGLTAGSTVGKRGTSSCRRARAPKGRGARC